MPTYVYRCSSCDRVEEVIQKISEKKAPDHCGTRMDEVIGSPIFMLKGSGWARDGYSSSKITS